MKLNDSLKRELNELSQFYNNKMNQLKKQFTIKK